MTAATCPDELLVHARAGSLSPRDRLELEAHLASCASCRTLVQLGRDFDDLLGAREGDEEIGARIAARLSPKRSPRLRPLLVAGAVLGSVAAAAAMPPVRQAVSALWFARVEPTLTEPPRDASSQPERPAGAADRARSSAPEQRVAGPAPRTGASLRGQAATPARSSATSPPPASAAELFARANARRSECTGDDDDADGVPNDCDNCPGFDDDNLEVVQAHVEVTTQADLDALAGVGEITTGLTIGYAPIDGGFPVEVNLEPLTCLRVLGGTFSIYNAVGLENLEALRSLESVEWLIVANNPDLHNIDAFRRITSLGRVTISDNAALENLDGLSSVAHMEYLNLWSNPLLQNLDGLAALRSTEAQLEIASNDSIEHVAGLVSLDSVGSLAVSNNDALRELRGLHGLGQVTDTLEIAGNAALPSCEAELLRDTIGLANIGGTVSIEDNAGTGGCEQ